ncbi:conserved hypothetical protein [Perkinsus marinus ATCC 50983]|uniref:Meiosis-specific nuclear structural protein 1 n=1 Tax=Perkinsus marinus (strain ATCC 50983 / TXsc) TaxID=423536 RepID=C5M1A1_PERM5|nr:conserved hypothetical protein [Perkinsus marinus ATCC 50983]EEQ97223.1 conserved hypothetical protein [Perkinsus marinus ATCC 50983]|eukprot:XP_002764506.1 conserved hypothetical protein [Perkinsus marinus ATCC 50983]
MVIMRIRNGNGFTEDIRRDRHDAIATRRRAREEDSKQAAIVTKQQIAAAEANEKAKEEFRAHLADRLEKVARSIGKDLSENAKRREEEENRRLEAQLQAVEIAYQKAEANKRVRQEETRREILEGLSQHIRQKAKVKEVEEAVNKRQGEENHKVAIEALKDEEEENRRRRQKRAAMDEELEKQIWFTKLTTEEDRMEMDLQRRELELNQPLLREMAAHGYKEEKCRELLLSPQVDLTHE